MIWMLIGIFFFILFETPYFKDDALIRAAIYISIVGVSVLLGFKFIDARAIARKIKEVALNEKLSSWQKIQAMINVIIPVLAEIGESFEMFYGEQFPPLPDQTNIAEIPPVEDDTPATVAIDPETGKEYKIEPERKA